jgi:hypothetical protein
MTAAANAILLQTDQILVKPMNVSALLEVIEQRLVIGAPPARLVESVATILTRTTQQCIELWYSRVEVEPKLTSITLTMSNDADTFRRSSVTSSRASTRSGL